MLGRQEQQRQQGCQDRLNICILLSGGTGTRLGGDIPKQYMEVGGAGGTGGAGGVNGHMMVTHALSTVLASSLIDEVYVVAALEWRAAIERDALTAGLDISKLCGFAMPGRNRQESALNGMEKALSHHLSFDEDKDTAAYVGSMSTMSEMNSVSLGEQATVLIHDAARPMLSEDLLSHIYEALDGHDGVIPVLPMKDTVYRSADGSKVSELLDRSQIFAGQAPELFLFDKYYCANKELLPDKIKSINGATEPAIMAGMDIVMIPGDERNYKVTTGEDLARFREDVKKGSMKKGRMKGSI